MSDQLLTDRAFINSIVGEGTCFTGELNLKGLLRIDGDFIGSIHTDDKVLIGKNGRVQCTIHAGTVVIGGVLKGDIISTDKVIVLASGMILGNVTAPRLVVEDGVIISGNCKITEKGSVPDSDNRKTVKNSADYSAGDSEGESPATEVDHPSAPEGHIEENRSKGEKQKADEYSQWKS